MENVNSVCFVGKIEEINNIEGADKIVQAVISGWECVIQKDKHKVGELVVIATTDAIIPFEMAERLKVTPYLKNRKKTGQYTVKTTKLKGIYSTAMTLDISPFLPEGTDMMRDLGIQKYEEPAVQIQLESGRKVKYHNAKNAPGMFTEEDEIIITNKIHGTNTRYGIIKKNRLSILDRIKRFFGNEWIDYDFVYGSHEVEKGSDSQGFYSTDVWRTVGDNIEIKKILLNYCKWVGKDIIGEAIILYGEIYGPGIQKYYTYGRENLGISFFDIKRDGKYLSTEDFDLTINHLNLPKVEVLYKGKFDLEVIKSLQHGRIIPNSKVPEEGIVVKSITGDREKIAKFISNNYLEFQSKKEDSTDFH